MRAIQPKVITQPYHLQLTVSHIHISHLFLKSCEHYSEQK